MAEIAYLQVQRACNQSCLFCSNPSNGRIVPFEEAVEHVEHYAKVGAPGIILTGGEPTQYPHLAKLVRFIKDKKIHCRIITNGSNTWDYDFLKSLTDAGLDCMHISLYSHKQETHDFLTHKKGSWECIVRSF